MPKVDESIPDAAAASFLATKQFHGSKDETANRGGLSQKGRMFVNDPTERGNSNGTTKLCVLARYFVLRVRQDYPVQLVL